MQRRSTAWQFLVLPLLIYAVVIVVPFFRTILFSLTDWDGVSPRWNFVGVANYARVFSDPAFSASLLHNLLWMAIYLLLPTTLGLLLAIILDRKMRGATLFKTIIYLPMIFSLVIVGMIFTFIYEPRLGILNLTLRTLGVKKWSIAWLAEPNLALLSIIAAASWQHTGLCMVLFLAGLKTVRVDLVEAARIDGAGSWQLYWRVILPQLQNVTVIVISLTVINSLKSFDIVYIMTKGGPFRRSEVLTTFMFRESFWNYRMGYGSAVAVVLFFLILGIVAVYIRQTVVGDKQ
jgi:multiple sugar transport system permease protein